VRWSWLAAGLVIVALLSGPTLARSAAGGSATNVSGTISTDTTWTVANNPYVLTGNVTVAAGVTLTVEPGVVVKFNSQFRTLTVNGTLKAVGTAGSRIVFTSVKDDAAGGDTNGDGAATSPAAGDWWKLVVASTNDQTELKFVDVRYGGWGAASTDPMLAIEGTATVTLEDATVRFSQRSGVKVGTGSASAFPGIKIRRTVVSNNQNGISANQGWIAVSDRSLVGPNSADGLWFNLTDAYTGPTSTIMDSDVTGSGGRGIYVQTGASLATAKYPFGNRNNVYQNTGRQLDFSVGRREVDWTGNYWGSEVDYAFNSAVCLGVGQDSNGHLAYRASQANPPDGPIAWSQYLAGPPGQQVPCGYDKVKIDAAQFSRTYIGTLPRLPTGGTFGPCGQTLLMKKPVNCASDPVNTATGGFVHDVTDLSLPGVGLPFAFTRTYNSLDTLSGPLGPGWTHSYATALTIKTSGDVSVRGGDGQQVEYVKQPDGSYKGDAGALATLTKPGSSFELLTNDQLKYLFDAAGRLQSMRDRNNQGLTFAYDGNGRLTTITDSANRQITLTYNGSNQLNQIAVPDGRSVSYAYTNGRLTSVTDVTNKVWAYTYDAYGFLEKEIDPLTHTIVRNVYNREGRVVEQYDALNNKTSFAWDPATQTATITDARNNLWKDQYANNVLTKRIDALNNATEFGHNTALDNTSVKAPDGQQTTMSYDPNGNLLTATAPASLGSAQKTLVYNARNDVTQVTDARGKVTSYGYDASGNNTSVVQDGQTVATNAYNASGQLSSSTDGNNHTTTYTYDSGGNLASETDALGNKTTYAYDAAGRMTSKVDPRGNVQGANPNDFKTTYSYDAAGRLLTETDPLGNVTTSVYDATGNRTSVTDANNKITSYTYDAANRVLTETAPDTGVTSYTYDAVGNKLTEKDPNNNTTTYTYDADNRLASTTTPLGNKTTYFYDANGNLTKEVEPRGNVQGANPDDYDTLSSYDAAGRMLTSSDPLGNTTSYTYDTVGNRTAVTDANNHTTSYAYDGQNRLQSVTAPGGAATTYAYDAAGNLLSSTDPNNHVTSYAYDAADRLTSKTLPLNRAWTYSHDAAGNLTKTVDANGNATQTGGDGTTTQTWDRVGRLTGIDYSDATPDVTFAYDGVGNRTQMVDGAGTQTYTYDAVNRLKTVVRGGDTFSYNYDLAGNLSRRTYPDGTITDYTYDADSRMATVASGGQTTTYAYDPAGYLTSTTLPASNGHLEERTYDRAGRLTRVNNIKGSSVLADFTYTLDPVGNPTRVVRTGSAAGTTTYAYDNRDRLTDVCFQATCPGGGDPFVRWTYDAVGNRLTEARPTGTTNYTYNAADELTQAGSTSYTYDQNGNETGAGARTFTYDLANRLALTASGGTTTTYAHDGDGNRRQTTASGQTTKLLWDPNHPLPQLAIERDGAGALLRRYLYGRTRLSITSGGSSSYYHYDHLGSVANVTSPTGVTQWTYAYEPYGSTRTEAQDDSAAPQNSMKFAGELLDATGLYHLRAREYDPAVGRFLQVDPRAPERRQPHSATYVYAASRPTVFVDPSGRTLEPVDDGRDAASGVAAPVSTLTDPAPTSPLRSVQGPGCLGLASGGAGAAHRRLFVYAHLMVTCTSRDILISGRIELSRWSRKWLSFIPLADGFTSRQGVAAIASHLCDKGSIWIFSGTWAARWNGQSQFRSYSSPVFRCRLGEGVSALGQ
jgi:RHS repeat-associated protein